MDKYTYETKHETIRFVAGCSLAALVVIVLLTVIYKNSIITGEKYFSAMNNCISNHGVWVDTRNNSGTCVITHKDYLNDK